MERIINSNYSTMEELVENSFSYSIEEVHAYLENIIVEWHTNKISLAAMNSILKFAFKYLERPKIQISFKNRTPIPICYYSSFLLLGASFLYSYLKTLSFAVKLFPLNKTDKHLREFIEKKKPSVILFTMSQFLHVEVLKKIIPYLLDKNLKVFLGGIPFVYDKSLKKEFPDCIFPKGIADLSLLLNNLIKEDLI